MKIIKNLFALCILFLFMSGCNETQKQSDKKSNFKTEFKGKIAKTYEESVEAWPEKKRPPKGAPNLIVFLLDDVGFAQVGSFGGLIETPNIDKLADEGLRYNNFHTTALCSPSRATLMAGRNPHMIGLGSHALTAMGFPGYNAIVPSSAKSVANYLEEEGYVNYALGKWDHTPLYEVSQVGPFDRWPSDEGFAHSYTFMAADVHQFIPVMWNDHHPEPYRKTEHLDKDLADRAIDWITGHKSLDKELPFMMLWASGSMHSPHHAPDDYIAKYKGKFDMGWDKAREMILANQLEMGIAPANTKLSDRIDELPAWDSLNAQEKKLYAKQMEVFAAQMSHVDYQIGRVIETLKRIGEYDNTLIMVTADNGASGEGGLAGTFNETYVLNGMQTPFDANMRNYDNWGQADSYPHYHAGWAMAGNTPFQYFKQSEHRGGQQDALVISWPNGIKAKGEIRSQYHHISDIAPTIMEAVGIERPDEYHGIKQQPFTGISMNYSFDNASAPNAKKRQYYEMFGNRAIWEDGWKAVTLHANRMPWDVNLVADFDDDIWELYHVAEDFSESTDLAKQYPEKLEELKKVFEEEAWANQVYPMYDDMLARLNAVNYVIFGDKKEFTYYSPGAVRIAEKASIPVKGRSHKFETTIDLKGDEEGVIVSCGGMTGGYSMYIKDHKLHFDYNFLDGVHYHLTSPILPKGKTDLKFNFTLDKSKIDGTLKPWSGTGELYVNGEKVDEDYFEFMHISTYSLAETFDVGMDSGTQVDPSYAGSPFPFTGVIDKVVATLTD
ncbi:MAG: arylsulfatase [Flavobacteriaceae bacterium]|nr:arylsulfatase [Flavobacteriaceae bacterium]